MEIEKLIKLVQNTILKKKGFFLPLEKKEDNTHNVLLYLISKYAKPDFKVEESFYSLIYISMFGFIFGDRAQKDEMVLYYSPTELYDLIDKEYQDHTYAMLTVERELNRRSDIKDHVENIISSGKPYQTQLYKVKPKAVRDEVEHYLQYLKEKVYANEHM